jgi:Ca2+-binding RTX toxin-like protein
VSVGVVTGTDADDTLTGTAGDDTFYPGRGADTVSGGGGNDLFVPVSLSNSSPFSYYNGDDGYDVVDASATSDHLNFYASSGAFRLNNIVLKGIEEVHLGSGPDSININAAPSAVIVYAGGGNDYIITGTVVSAFTFPNETIYGEDGNDTITSSGGTDHIFGGAGDDRLNFAGNYAAGATFDGGDGRDKIVPTGSEIVANLGSGTLSFQGVTVLNFTSVENIDIASYTSSTAVAVNYATVIGNASDNVLRLVESWEGSPQTRLNASGWGGNDTLQGAGDADTLDGGDGDDQLDGLAGDDQLLGQAGRDTLMGGDGSDTLSGGAGEDFVRGGVGADSLSGGDAFDDLHGNEGDDTVRGGLGDDWVVGGKDQDILYGEDGFDVVYGNLGNDTCYGGDGADWVRGGQGDDVVDGGAGDDWMAGDRGNDTVTGGAGADRFYFFAGAGLDRVTDFNSAQGDRVLLDDGQAYTLSYIAEGVLVDLGGGDQMLLVGVTQQSLGDWLV